MCTKVPEPRTNTFAPPTHSMKAIAPITTVMPTPTALREAPAVTTEGPVLCGTAPPAPVGFNVARLKVLVAVLLLRPELGPDPALFTGGGT